MPLTRYQIRNEYSLADPELYKAADRDDPEALLEGVDMAGLIGVLRQLGDLAEFAAEIFHDLHEEVMATAARGHGLMVRVHQIEAEFPSIEKALLLQTNHSSFYSNAGVDWHPNLQMKQNLITRGDLPRCVMDSYEECRGPPRLFLLDKFDVAGAGACLKRYTDPSLFKVEAAPSSIPSVDVQREKRIRKAKKKGSRWRNGETPEITTASHAKLHELFLVENIEKSRDNPARLVKLKKRQLNASPFDPRSGKSYMEKFLESPMERNVVREISVTPLALKLTSDNSNESGPEIHDISAVSPVNKSSQGKDDTYASPNACELLKSSINESYREVIDRQSMDMPETPTNGVTDEKPSMMHKVTIEKEIVVDGQGKIDPCLERDRSDDMISEVENYMDALATMESEMETDNDYRSRTGHGFSSVPINGADSDRNEENMELQANSWDSHSIGNYSSSDDGNSSLKKEKSSFSYSDTQSNLAENAQSDGEEAVHVVHSETCTSEISEMHSNHPPVNVQIPRANSQDLVLSINRCMDENNIHNPEVLKPSDYCSTDSSLQQSYSAASAEQQRIDETLLHQFDETQSVCTKPGSELSSVNESAANLVDSSAVYPLASEGTKDDSLSAVCAAGYPLDKLDGVLPDFFSDALLRDSNNSELVPAKQSSDPSVGEELHTDSADEKCAQNMVNYQTSDIRSLSTATPREEQSHLSALPESEVLVDVTPLADCSDVVRCDNLVFQSDNSSRLTGSGPENLTSIVDTSDPHNFKEELLTENLPHARPDSLEQAVLCSKNQANLEDTRRSIGSVEHDSKEESLEYSAEDANVDDASRTGDGENISLSTSKVDEVEVDAIPHEFPSSSPACSTLEGNVDIDDVVAGSVQNTEITVVSDGVLADTVDEDCKDVVCQPLASESSDLMKILEFANAADDQHRAEVEVEEPFSSEHLGESEVEKKKDDPEVVPSVLPFTGCKLVSNEDANSEMVDCTQDPVLVHTTESNLNARDISTEPAHSELSRQLNCPHPEDGGDTMFSPNAHLPVLETSSDQLLESQFDQSGLQDLETEKARSKSRDDPCHIDQENHSDDASEFSGNLPTQPSASESLPQLTLQEASLLPSFGMLHEAPQVSLEMPPLPPLPPMQWRVGKTQPAPTVPDSVLIKQSQESFPSLPSLEQDETKKFGYPGPHGGDSHPGNPFLPLAAAESDKAENMSETVVGNIMQTTVQPTVSPSEFPSIADNSNCQHLNLSLELSELPDEEPEHDSAASEKEVVQSSSNLLLPDSSKENTALKDDTVALQKTESHSPNQLASETGLEDEVLEEASLNLERDHDNTCDMSVLSPRKVEEQPQHCLEDEVPKEALLNLERDHDSTCDMSVLPPRKVEEQPQHCLEDEVLKEALLNLERDHDNTCDMSVLPPRKVEEQPQQGLLNSGGESAWPENPFVLPPTSKSGKPNGSSVTKIPRPRNPLIDAVAAHDKSKLRKVTERVLPQSEPKVDERDSLLEQIRTKSFNLKRAVVTRPSMPGPTPNLKLAAILEKANAIRHATAGSDEDDSDSWSDS